MMGHREKLVSADEVDAISKLGRSVLRFRSGRRGRIKRTLAKRVRRCPPDIETHWLDERDADAFTERMVKAIMLGMEADAELEKWIRSTDSAS